MIDNCALVIIKPDAVKRNLHTAILTILQNQGFRLMSRRHTHLTRPQLAEHYVEHSEKPFYRDLIDFMSSGPAIVFVVEKNEDCVKDLRALVGPTNPHEAPPDTIRGLLRRVACPVMENLIHASDSPESARREIRNFFPDRARYD